MPRAIDKLVGAGPGEHVDAYMEYSQLVGRLDGGKLLSEPEFEAIKQKALNPARRLYVNWRNMENGIDCKAIGPQSMCFCTHRYNEHDWSAFESRQVRCLMPGCTCQCFDYIPVRGSQVINCSTCKQAYTQHRPSDHACFGGGGKFTSSHICSCTGTYAKHRTVFESRAERVQAGRAVDTGWMEKAAREGLPVCHLGGILGFTSLADGVDRVMAGLEQGIDPEEAAAYGAMADGSANQFVQRMQMHDDVNTASLVHGKAAGYRALAKAKQQQKQARAQALQAPMAPPKSRSLSIPGAPKSNVHGLSSGTPAALAAVPPPPSTSGPSSSSSSKARASGHSPPLVAAAKSRPTAIAATAQRNLSAPPATSGAHRLGGMRRQDPEAVRRARLAYFDS